MTKPPVPAPRATEHPVPAPRATEPAATAGHNAPTAPVVGTQGVTVQPGQAAPGVPVATATAAGASARAELRLAADRPKATDQDSATAGKGHRAAPELAGIVRGSIVVPRVRVRIVRGSIVVRPVGIVRIVRGMTVVRPVGIGRIVRGMTVVPRVRVRIGPSLTVVGRERGGRATIGRGTGVQQVRETLVWLQASLVKRLKRLSFWIRHCRKKWMPANLRQRFALNFDLSTSQSRTLLLDALW